MSANENPSPDAMLDSIAALIREFLVCDDHQLTVLTLWVLHTWVYQVFPTTPYLPCNRRSRFSTLVPSSPGP